jgi:hypothetical protein
MSMKVIITGYDAVTDVFTYNVLRSADNALASCHGLAINGTDLNALSVSLPHSKPGQMTDIEILLAMIHDSYFIEEPGDLLDQHATCYMVPGKKLHNTGRLTQSTIDKWVAQDRKEIEAFEKAGDIAQGDGKPLRLKLRSQELPDGCVPLNGSNIHHLRVGEDK